MANKQQMIGMRGVYLAAAELARQGFIVSPTSRSAAGADLLVTDDKCQRAFSIQVKTTAGYNFWLLNAKVKETTSPSHLYMFVEIQDKKNIVAFYIVPSVKVSEHHDVVHQKKNIWYSFSRAKAQEHQITL